MANVDPLLRQIVDRTDPSIVGVVLSGSAARGMATERSDLDVYVVYQQGTPADVSRSPELDEIPITLEELEDVPPPGAEDYWHRWSFAYADVVRDDLGGRVRAAVRRQATLTADEQLGRLVGAAGLDSFLNSAYRALKSDRDGRRSESRLDAAESIPFLLSVAFALAGRVRPYNKYLAWELGEHPLAVPEWSAERLMPQLDEILDGDPVSVRAAVAVVERECRAFDERRGGTTLGDVIDAWGDELAVLRGE